MALSALYVFCGLTSSLPEKISSMNFGPMPAPSAKAFTSSNVMFLVLMPTAWLIVSIVDLTSSVVAISGRLNASSGGFSMAGSVVCLRSWMSLRWLIKASGVRPGCLDTSTLAAIFASVLLVVVPVARAALVVSSTAAAAIASGLTGATGGLRISTLPTFFIISETNPVPRPATCTPSPGSTASGMIGATVASISGSTRN